ncbi:MAG: DUF481 domain-containing protein, partial [Kiritimatiellia bacterium]
MTCRLTLLAPLLLAAFALHADTVETVNGDRLSGKIKQVQKGIVTLTTDYAGDIAIKQDLIAKMTTDEPVLTRPSTNWLETAVEAPLVYTAADSNRVVTLYRKGAPDPDKPKESKRWASSVGIRFSGQSGNTDSFATGLNADFVRTGKSSLLKVYGKYDYKEVNNNTDTDLINFGADFEYNISPMQGLFIRDDNIKNRIQDIRWRVSNSAGYSLYFWRSMDAKGTGIKNALRLRAGVGYVWDYYYADGSQPEGVNESSIADIGIWFRQRLFENVVWNTEVTLQPSLQVKGDIYGRQETTLSFPLIGKSVL